jgi:hypothetical protein
LARSIQPRGSPARSIRSIINKRLLSLVDTRLIIFGEPMLVASEKRRQRVPASISFRDLALAAIAAGLKFNVEAIRS